jgi:dsRNA-specific ribonuclease
MVGSWTKSRGALQEYRLARSLGMPVYRYIAEEIRPMPAPALQVYDALAEEALA